jgi:hypothetical protein
LVIFGFGWFFQPALFSVGHHKFLIQLVSKVFIVSIKKKHTSRIFYNNIFFFLLNIDLISRPFDWRNNRSHSGLSLVRIWYGQSIYWKVCLSVRNLKQLNVGIFFKKPVVYQKNFWKLWQTLIIARKYFKNLPASLILLIQKKNCDSTQLKCA